MKRISFAGTLLPKLGLGLVVTLLLTVLSACAPEADNSDASYQKSDQDLRANVIYGSDGRLDLFQVTDDRLKLLADSTVALVKTSDLSVSGATVSILGQNFGTSMNLCSTEKFRDQDTAAFCSGSLVGPDIVITAGHCIEALADCQSTSFVFGFAVKSASVLPKQVSSSEVYKCKEIIRTARNNSGADYAIVRLDRSVSNHAALPVRQSGEVAVGDGLVVIGHPVGLPTKITTGGKVRSIANSEFILASADTYGGNSGSAVFNAQTGLIEGILVRGEQDFQTSGSCTVSKVCAEDSCRGEDITRISVVRAFLPAQGNNGGGGTNPPPVEPPVVVVGPESFSTVVNKTIPDNNATGISSSLQVTSAVQGRKVSIKLDIVHSYIGDLVVKVTAPDGKSAVLHQRAGGRAVNIQKSYEVTSSLGGVAVAGVYKLTVQDLASRDIGTLKSWTVEFK